MLVLGLGKKTEALCNKLSTTVELFEFSSNKPEEIENEFDTDKVEQLLSNNKCDICVVCFSNNIESAAVLRLLESIKLQNRSASVLLLRKTDSFLTVTQKKMDRLVFGVLQQKARSEVVDNLILVDLTRIGEMLADQVTISNYGEVINDQISSTVKMFFQLKDKKSEYDSMTELDDSNRIMTLGMVDFESGDETSLFDLKFPREKRYYYLLSEETMNRPGLLKRIHNQMKIKRNDFVNQVHKNLKFKKDYDKRNIERLINIGFGVYKTPFEQDYIYVSTHSSFAWDEQEY